MIPSIGDRLRPAHRPRLGPRRAGAPHGGGAEGVPASLFVVRHPREPSARTGTDVPPGAMRRVLRVPRRLQARRDLGVRRPADCRPERLPVVRRLRGRLHDRRPAPNRLGDDRVARARRDRTRRVPLPSVRRRRHFHRRRATPAIRLPRQAARRVPGPRHPYCGRHLRGGACRCRRPHCREGRSVPLRPQAPGGWGPPAVTDSSNRDILDNLRRLVRRQCPSAYGSRSSRA